VLIFLNNDTQILSEDWLTRLVTHAASPEVGAVGAKLLYHNGRIQHIGVVLDLEDMQVTLARWPSMPSPAGMLAIW
jgi:GT2 family glycosyltransferase